LNQAVEFYTDFVKFIFGKEHPGGCVPLLKYMIGKFIFLLLTILLIWYFCQSLIWVIQGWQISTPLKVVLPSY
jgi:hypothetical protein